VATGKRLSPGSASTGTVTLAANITSDNSKGASFMRDEIEVILQPGATFAQCRAIAEAFIQ
jgi:hypothetical protein